LHYNHILHTEICDREVFVADMNIERPACFYLGREYDLAQQSVLDRPVMYDARDLTTHGVVVGMTGSGKTGLCINLLEEAALDGIPCIIIDPKGDLTNLLLQFPELRPEDFSRWLNPEDARQKGITLEEHAQHLAEQWRQGVTESGQTPERIARLRDSSEWRIYTPGSEAGLPLSILSTFTAPKGQVTREALNQKIDATTTALLGLTGIAGDPVQSREHILIAQLLLHAWQKGQDLDLPQLISQIQAPPLRKIGAFDVDTFYPEKDRLKLAVALNNILAAPSFSTWITGEALDLSHMLASPDGKPRQLIFYVAHLEDAQRLFFLTLLLEEVLSWTRKQPGTTNLRAILYFDEVFGYLPPHPANPPTKTPLMTLLKQARAFGVGVLLATQNPVDLDYKALSNAGTWFVGKLQTERDKARLLEGLEGVAAEQGTLHDRAYLETVISALGNRVFLLHNVHHNKPVLFKSRWALSFLRGPMTREQVALLMDDFKRQHGDQVTQGRNDQQVGAPPTAILLCSQCRAELEPGATVCSACGRPNVLPQQQDKEFKDGLLRVTAPLPLRISNSTAHVPPVLPANVAQFYLPVQQAVPAQGSVELIYEPRLLGFAEVIFSDRRRGLEHRRTYRLLAEPVPAGQSVHWATATKVSETIATVPHPDARWPDAPESLNSARKLTALKRTLIEFLYGNAKLLLLTNRPLNLVSEPTEDVLAFQARCRAAAGQELDKALTAEKLKVRPRFEALNALPPDEAAGTNEKADNSGTSILGRLLNPFSRVSDRPARQEETLRKLEAAYRARCVALVEKWRGIGEEYVELPLKPRKSDVQVTHFGLSWAPYWHVTENDGTQRAIAAYLQ
jgi:Helicase HerA, central domain